MGETTVRQSIRSLEDAIARCHGQGMRVSKQRRFILELLWQVNEHLSAREIYDRLNAQGKDIGYTSVYQNLDALSSHRIIECIERTDGRLYGSLSDSHSHINCVDTEQIIDIHVKLPDELIQAIETQMGVRITDYRIDFYGHLIPDEDHDNPPSAEQSQESKPLTRSPQTFCIEGTGEA